MQLQIQAAQLNEDRVASAASGQFLMLVLATSAALLTLLFGGTPRTVFIVVVIVSMLLLGVNVVATHGLKTITDRAKQQYVDELAKLTKRAFKR